MLGILYPYRYPQLCPGVQLCGNHLTFSDLVLKLSEVGMEQSLVRRSLLTTAAVGWILCSTPRSETLTQACEWFIWMNHLQMIDLM